MLCAGRLPDYPQAIWRNDHIKTAVTTKGTYTSQIRFVGKMLLPEVRCEANDLNLPSKTSLHVGFAATEKPCPLTQLMLSRPCVLVFS